MDRKNIALHFFSIKLLNKLSETVSSELNI